MPSNQTKPTMQTNNYEIGTFVETMIDHNRKSPQQYWPNLEYIFYFLKKWVSWVWH